MTRQQDKDKRMHRWCQLFSSINIQTYIHTIQQCVFCNTIVRFTSNNTARALPVLRYCNAHLNWPKQTSRQHSKPPGMLKLSGFFENDWVWTMICLNWLSYFMICLYLSQYFDYVLFYVTGDSWLADFIVTSIVVPVCIPLFGVSYIGSYLFLLLPAWVVGLEVSFPVNCCYLLNEKSRDKKA